MAGMQLPTPVALRGPPRFLRVESFALLRRGSHQTERFVPTLPPNAIALAAPVGDGSCGTPPHCE